jgi:NAD(P)H-flavin reductase
MASDAPPAALDAGATGHPWAPRPYVVHQILAETSDTSTLVLRPASGETPATTYLPGQFNMLYAFGIGEAAISVSGDPRRPGELVHTVRAVGKVTGALGRARPGEVVGVRGPYGVGWPLDRAQGRDVILLAGGLGLAPLRPALYALFAERARYGRIEIILGARTPADLLYYPELQQWRARTDARLQVTVDSAGREWYGDVGVATARLPDARFDPDRTVAFVCGPEIMMRLSAQALEARGVPPEAIYLSMERNMKCAIGQCGHCQLGPEFVCRDGPVLPWARLGPYLRVREL